MPRRPFSAHGVTGYLWGCFLPSHGRRRPIWFSQVEADDQRKGPIAARLGVRAARALQVDKWTREGGPRGGLPTILCNMGWMDGRTDGRTDLLGVTVVPRPAPPHTNNPWHQWEASLATGTSGIVPPPFWARRRDNYTVTYAYPTYIHTSLLKGGKLRQGEALPDTARQRLSFAAATWEMEFARRGFPVSLLGLAEESVSPARPRSVSCQSASPDTHY